MAYYQKRSGLVGYSAGGAGYTDKLVVTQMLYGEQQWGADGFWPIHAYDAKWYAVLETGEIRLTPEGTKASIYEVHLQTSVEDDSTYTECPDAIVQMIGVGDSSWTTGGDSNGTISVGTSYVTGTGTSWSNRIARGDDSTTVFTTPAPAAKCRIYKNSVLQTLNTDYTITGTKQITFATAPRYYYPVDAYWTGEPEVTVAVGDYIETSYGLHRITAIPTATTIAVEYYPPSASTGTHLPAKQLVAGDNELVFGLRGTVDRVRFKIYLIPRVDPVSVRFIKNIALSTVFTPAGSRQLEE